MVRFAYYPTGISNFKAKSQWQDGNSEPQAGNIIFFDWDGGHVGIVEKYENGTVYTIKGNSGDMIAKRTYSKDSAYIAGYGLL